MLGRVVEVVSSNHAQVINISAFSGIYIYIYGPFSVKTGLNDVIIIALLMFEKH